MLEKDKAVACITGDFWINSLDVQVESMKAVCNQFVMHCVVGL